MKKKFSYRRVGIVSLNYNANQQIIINNAHQSSLNMPEYRRLYLPSATIFLTLVTYQRQPLFSNPENISRLREATAQMRREKPFDIIRAVVLPDHIHFLWTLPLQDTNYSQRVSRLKVLFTWSLRGRKNKPQNISQSRRKHP